MRTDLKSGRGRKEICILEQRNGQRLHGEKRSREIKKEDLDVSDLPSSQPQGIYAKTGKAFMRKETHRWRETGRKIYELNIKNKG